MSAFEVHSDGGLERFLKEMEGRYAEKEERKRVSDAGMERFAGVHVAGSYVACLFG